MATSNLETSGRRVFGPLTVDVLGRVASYNGKPVNLATREWNILELGTRQEGLPGELSSDADVQKTIRAINGRFFVASGKTYVPFDRRMVEPADLPKKSRGDLAPRRPAPRDRAVYFFVVPGKKCSVLDDYNVVFNPARHLTPAAKRRKLDGLANGG
jgi:hypothetical protein